MAGVDVQRGCTTPGPSNPIPCSFFEPLARSWSHFVAMYRQKLSKSSKIDLRLRFEGPGVVQASATRRRLRTSTRGPSWGHILVVLGAIVSFFEPLFGHLSPKIDKVSYKLTFEYPNEEPCVAVTSAGNLLVRATPPTFGWWVPWPGWGGGVGPG